MNLLEQGAAWLLWSWFKRQGGPLMVKALGNWRTTVAGAVVGLITSAQYLGFLDPEQAATLIGLLVSLGLLVAKDGATGSSPN